jgi:DNA-binding transcriptional ArsR family regulator
LAPRHAQPLHQALAFHIRPDGQRNDIGRFETAEGEIRSHEPAVDADVDDLFYREWVRALLERSVSDLRRFAEQAGRPAMFEVFARYDLLDDAETRPTYTEIARALNVTPATVTNHLAAMRREFRKIVLDRLRELTSSDEEWEAEAARLLGAKR